MPIRIHLVRIGKKGSLDVIQKSPQERQKPHLPHMLVDWTVRFKFFDTYQSLMDKYKFPANNIYNVDETGMTKVQGSAAKILAMKGRSQVGCLTTAERGTLVTVVMCMNVTGSFVPPFIWPRKRMKAELMVFATQVVGRNLRYSVSGLSFCDIFWCFRWKWDLASKKGKWGGTSEGKDENGKMDVWCEVTR